MKRRARDVVLAIAGSAVIVTGLAGCGNQDNAAEVGKSLVTINLSQPTTNKMESNSTTADALSKVPQLNTGEFSAHISEGKVSLYANEASRLAVINNLAERIGFSLHGSSTDDVLVTLSVEYAGMPGLIDQILTGERYHTKYAPKANRHGFRLSELRIGLVPVEHSPGIGTEVTDLDDDTETLLGLPPINNEIYLGDEQDDADLVSRLLDELPQNRADAVSELRMTPVEVEAAYQVYMREESQEVRLAILELLGAEDLFLVKQLLLTALQDPSPELVMAALSAIEASGDYSLVPHIETLTNHSSMEVRAYAKVVQDSLTSAFFTPEEYAENKLTRGNDVMPQTEEDLVPGDYSQ